MLPGGTAAGSYTIQAVYNPSPNFSGSSDNTHTLTVNKAGQSINFSINPPGSAAYGSTFTVAATGGGSGNAVTFSSSGACSNAGATFTMTASTGICSAIANQQGNSNYSPGQATMTVNAFKAVLTVNEIGRAHV